MHHTINIMLSHQQKQVHDLAIASLSHACCYSQTLVGSFQGVKIILYYAYSFYSETPMLLPNQYSKEVKMHYGTPVTSHETGCY